MIRHELRQLHELAGKPTGTRLESHSTSSGHSVGRSTLLAVLSGDDTKGLRWATVEAFVDACASYAKAKGQALPPTRLDKLAWRTRFDQAYPAERSDLSQSWPRRVGIVPPLAGCFQTRAMPDSILAVAGGRGAAVLDSSATQVLSGLGGVGKTQIAVYLAEELWRRNQVDLLVWISATSRQAILAGYAHAAADLALTGANGADAERDAARFHAWLASTDRRWLIVLDDLANTADLQRLWPPVRPNGRTVVTTRLRGSALEGADRHLIQVGTFMVEEAELYLNNRLRDHLQLADDVAGVATDLGLLPLALAQAAAFIVDEQLSCSQYRRRLAAYRARLDDLVPDASGPTGLPDDYARTVAATLSLSIDVAQIARPARLARPLLELASVLDPAGIPTEVFTTTAARNWLCYRRGRGDTLDDDLNAMVIQSGLRSLHRLNLLTVDSDAGIVAVHALVQRVIREPFTDEHLADVAWAAADALDEAWPEVERDSGAAQRLRSNATVLYRHGHDALLQPDAHPVLGRANRSLGESGDLAGALQATRQLLADQLRVLGPSHPNTQASRGNAAYWQGAVGDLAGAAASLEELLSELTVVLGHDHVYTLTTRGNLAHLRGEAGDPAGAAAAIEQLVPDLIRVLGPDDPRTLSARGNLAHWRGEAGDVIAAATATEELIADLIRVLGPDHPDTLVMRSNLAAWHTRAGNPAGAGAINDEVLVDCVEVLGPDHPRTLLSRSNLAAVRGELGDPAGAANAIQELLLDLVRVLGKDHPDTLAARNQLASWRREAGDRAGAATALQHLLTDRIRVLGPDHPDTLATRSNLANVRGEFGDLVGAVKELKELIGDVLRVLGPDHLDTLTIRGHLARWRNEAGDRAGAAALDPSFAHGFDRCVS
ncbi:tetratricopeptide repeat protein [Phytohabitans suffuscus]|uniref:Tetratricopeptide repeat protein n=1 Tax=Phytohabitans suffuscus TaxID=624315 RepID=A0A6F8YSS0_9ACTN|nr:tetratricopeptide repeat protein [Phytohabitans suffuscus]BCB88881.1 tetratricopeptide repeat protein [Phytohabitans suffuscus]